MAKEDNLVPQAHVLTLEEQSEAGKKSGETRRKKKTFKQAISWLAENGDLKITQGDLYELYMKNGIDVSNLDPTQLATIGLWFGAATGKAENYKTLMVGNGEVTEAITEAETPDVELKVIDTSGREKAFWNDEEN